MHALGAADYAQALAGHRRIHTGTPHMAEEGYVGPDVHRAARIAACGPTAAVAGAIVLLGGVLQMGALRSRRSEPLPA